MLQHGKEYYFVETYTTHDSIKGAVCCIRKGSFERGFNRFAPYDDTGRNSGGCADLIFSIRYADGTSESKMLSGVIDESARCFATMEGALQSVTGGYSVFYGREILENSVILPCNVGDVVYVVDFVNQRVIVDQAQSIMQIMEWVVDGRFGKDIFLNEDEAELWLNRREL